jgi:ketosteroid isomerase-like protein
MNATMVDVRERLQQLIGYIREGRILDAINEFYAEDTQMQENANTPTVGLAANLEREQQFLKGVKEWRDSQFKVVGAGDDVTFYEGVFDWVATDGTPVHVEQVAVQRWRNGKIIHERFYYDTGSGR